MTSQVQNVIQFVSPSSISAKEANSQPLCSQWQKTRPFPLSDIKDIRIQEGLIIKDLIYVLLGLEGSYIKYSDKYDPRIERLKRLGPDYKINKHLDSSLKNVTKRVVHLSKMFSALTTFTEVFNVEIYGKITQSLVYEIRQFLKTYVLFINNLEQSFSFNKDFSLRTLEQSLKTNIALKMTHFYDIVLTIYDFNDKRGKETSESAFDNFIQNIRHDLKYTGSIDLLSDSSIHNIAKGGIVLKIIQQKLDDNSGDFKSNEFLSDLFNRVSQHYITILNTWITKGELNDPYNEFFITTNLVHNFKVNSFNSEQYWESKFVIKKDGLPKQFLDREIQSKVLATGKFLNILKESGITLDSFSESKVVSLNSSNLYLILEEAYSIANRFIVDLFLSGYGLKNTLKRMERYYLLDNALNLTEFINLSYNEFKKHYEQVSTSRLNRNFELIFNDGQDDEADDLVFQLLNVTVDKEPIYNYILEILKVEAIDAEQALHSSNFDSLKILLSKTLDIEKEAGKDSKSTENLRCVNFFNLDIILPFPLNLIATRTVIIQYQLIFRHLVNLHFTEKQLNVTWLEINKNKIWKHNKFDNPMPKWILRARSLHDRMKDFFKVYFSYLNTDVIDVSWKQFMNDFDSINDFEQITTNLQSFLNTVLKNSILSTEKLIKILSKIIQIINAYCSFLLSLRKVLILLNYELFEKYNDRLKGQSFDYNKNLERMEKLNTYLNEYLDSFSQHLNGFIEGLRYYGEIETPAFIVLAHRLEQSFPSKTKEQSL